MAQAVLKIADEGGVLFLKSRIGRDAEPLAFFRAFHLHFKLERAGDRSGAVRIDPAARKMEKGAITHLQSFDFTSGAGDRLRAKAPVGAQGFIVAARINILDGKGKAGEADDGFGGDVGARGFWRDVVAQWLRGRRFCLL